VSTAFRVLASIAIGIVITSCQHTTSANRGCIEGVVWCAKNPSSLLQSEPFRRKPDKTLKIGPNGALLEVVVSLSTVPNGGEVRNVRHSLQLNGDQWERRIVLCAPGDVFKLVNTGSLDHLIEWPQWAVTEGDDGGEIPELRTVPIALVGNGSVTETLPSVPITYALRCEFHGELFYAAAFAHSYASVSDENGRFRIDGVPVGTHSITTWHNALGFRTVKIHVKAGETTRIEIVY
jgi:hypothetical protein